LSLNGLCQILQLFFCYRQVCAKRKPAGIAFTQWCSGQKWVFLPLAAKLLIGSKKVRGGAKMVRTFSITMPSMVGIVGRASAVDEKV